MKRSRFASTEENRPSRFQVGIEDPEGLVPSADIKGLKLCNKT